MPIRLLIVDDHPIVRIGLCKMLGRVSSIEVVGMAATVEEAVKTASDTRPDVILLDPGLGLESGFEICPIVAKNDPTPKVLVVTAVIDSEVISLSLRHQVNGCIQKEIDSEALVTAICKVSDDKFSFES